ncbi:hypothetical protein N7E81_13490 [Reichenbachiella carrageenanivorans]|uniref:DUF3999 domain-containing protein n=1 Tax=Reichenbachiella carrageenanivorans TaxID=2979869 RepID=A0ABY6CXC4_9BACT|nr:hypothetical protein [Reichenbachiella carrageenanivorans]UXX78369.1 hypothetical protein N7E81_13490 [Reichenbachiella carrageenanivorans]
MMKRKNSWLLGVLLISTSVFGQEFAYEASLLQVRDAGYYQVMLSPELLGQAKPNLSDVRIYDKAGVEQPYLLRREQEVSTKSLFRAYEITDKAYQQNAISHLIFSNSDKRAIDNVSIEVKNTDAKKRARLSGSDDLENWYVIRDNYLLHAMQSEEETTELKILNFPLSDYAYFKLEINDNWRLPINILKVGYYDTQQVKGATTTYDCPIIEQKDSLKTSYVRVVFDEPVYMEQLQLMASGADFYSRFTKVKTKRIGIDKKNKAYEYWTTLKSFELNSNSENKVSFSGVTVSELDIEIDNRDNAPLKVEQVKAGFLNKYVVLALKPENSYVIKLGNDHLATPDYDIAKFASQISADSPKLVHGALVDIRPKEEPKAPDFWDNKYLVWLVIAVVGFGLAYVSFKMIKEIGGKE